MPGLGNNGHGGVGRGRQRGGLRPGVFNSGIDGVDKPRACVCEREGRSVLSAERQIREIFTGEAEAGANRGVYHTRGMRCSHPRNEMQRCAAEIKSPPHSKEEPATFASAAVYAGPLASCTWKGCETRASKKISFFLRHVLLNVSGLCTHHTCTPNHCMYVCTYGNRVRKSSKTARRHGLGFWGGGWLASVVIKVVFPTHAFVGISVFVVLLRCFLRWTAAPDTCQTTGTGGYGCFAVSTVLCSTTPRAASR